jgi:hypothetical protein
MKNYFLTYFITIFLIACGLDSQKNEINILSQPNFELYNQFDFSPKGQIIYQFYHEFGFADKVWHLITIIKPDSNLVFENTLPIDSLVMNNVERIYLDKFVEGFPIQFNYDYEINSDVSIRAEEYHNEEFKLNVNHDNGTYLVKKIGDIYILRIYDNVNNLEYIELKKYS